MPTTTKLAAVGGVMDDTEAQDGQPTEGNAPVVDAAQAATDEGINATADAMVAGAERSEYARKMDAAKRIKRELGKVADAYCFAEPDVVVLERLADALEAKVDGLGARQRQRKDDDKQ